MMTTLTPPSKELGAPRGRGGMITLVVCAGLLVVFAALSWSAARTKSATNDEVLHTPAGYTHLRYLDFRANPEHPPLWKYWAAIPWLVRPPADALVDGPAFGEVVKGAENHWAWAIDLLYHTPGNDPENLIGMSRGMMLVWGVALGAVLAWWANRLAGGVAAVVACGVYALDPNFLAHAPLMTNDVCFSLVVLWFAYAVWRLGEGITWGRVAGVAGCCAVAFVTKFTSVLLVPALVGMLGVRAMMPTAWAAPQEVVLGTRGRRLAVAGGIVLLCAVVTYVAIWGAYGFRFRVAPDPDVRPAIKLMVDDAIANEIMGTTGHGATAEDVRRWKPSLYIRTCVFAIEHRLAPEAYTCGLLFAYSKSLYRWSYFMGTITGMGHRSYFPVAFLVKTPLTTLVLVFVSVVGCAVYLWRRRVAGDVWLVACLGIPSVMIGYALIRSHMNLGLRHAFPVYPPLFLLLGVVAAKVYAWRPRFVRGVLVALAVGLAAETVPAYPNYIPFFNAAAGGYRGGFRMLGDSNLDWGQDLPLLKKWQEVHPDRTLYLAYTGTADPAWYGIRFVPLTLNTGFQITRKVFPTSGVVAASATMLQNDWVRPEANAFFKTLRDTEPTEVLGGSIYIFDLGGK